MKPWVLYVIVVLAILGLIFGLVFGLRGPDKKTDSLFTSAKKGDKKILVKNLEKFSIGDTITIDPGGVKEEFNQVIGFGSLNLGTPLQNDHDADTTVTITGNTPLWVAVGQQSGEITVDNFPEAGNILYSLDGIKWVTSNSTIQNEGLTAGNGVAYGKDKWVAVGLGTPFSETIGSSKYTYYAANIFYSPDGITWTISGPAPGLAGGAKGVAHGIVNGSPGWVAVGTNLLIPYEGPDKQTVFYPGTTSNGNILYSPDGINWNISSSSSAVFAESGNAVAYGVIDGEPGWVAVGYNGTESTYENILYSTDGMTWVQSNPGGGYLLRGFGVTYGNGIWVATGLGESNLSQIVYSTDGKNWIQGPTDVLTDGGQAVTYSKRFPVELDNTFGFIATGYDFQNNIVYSANGASWKKYSNGFENGNGLDVACGVYTCVAVGQTSATSSSGNILYLKNGEVSWNSSDSSGAGFPASGNGVAYKY